MLLLWPGLVAMTVIASLAPAVIPVGYMPVAMEVTAYAPLDPAAVEGMCHDGDPWTTASGARSTPGRSIAVDPDVIPLGSRVWIAGIGWRVAEDVGGAINGHMIDLMVESREGAFAWGRQERIVWIPR